MKVGEISKIVNEALNEAMGVNTGADVGVEFAQLVDLGRRSIASAGTDMVENLYKSLLDRVYKTILTTRRYIPTDNGIIRDYETYGAILQKVYYEPLRATVNASHGLKNGESVDPFKVTLNVTDVKIFSKRTSWEIPYTVQADADLRSAFLSEEALCTFIEQLALMAENSMNAQIEAIEQYTICNFIDQKIEYFKAYPNGVQVVNLLEMYKELNPTTTVNSSTYIYDADFLRFASMTIKLYYNKMASGKYSILFNTEQCKRFTRPEDARIMLLSDFNTAMETYLQSDTYHKSLVELPQFSTVPYWQGSGDHFDLESCSSISQSLSGSSDPVIRTHKGIVGFMFDVDALGITIWNKKTTSQYNGRGEYTNYWLKADIGLFNDLSENAIVFVVQDAE